MELNRSQKLATGTIRGYAQQALFKYLRGDLAYYFKTQYVTFHRLALSHKPGCKEVTYYVLILYHRFARVAPSHLCLFPKYASFDSAYDVRAPALRHALRLWHNEMAPRLQMCLLRCVQLSKHISALVRQFISALALPKNVFHKCASQLSAFKARALAFGTASVVL